MSISLKDRKYLLLVFNVAVGLTHGLGFFTLGVEYGELELGSNFRLVARDE